MSKRALYLFLPCLIILALISTSAFAAQYLIPADGI
jgi:hypothetical protein